MENTTTDHTAHIGECGETQTQAMEQEELSSETSTPKKRRRGLSTTTTDGKKRRSFLLDEKCGESFNVIVALLRDGKVHALKEFDERDDYFHTKIGIYQKRGYEVEVYEIKEKKKPKSDTFRRNGKPKANKVRCVENDEEYKSVGAASSILGISKDSIYKSLSDGTAAGGFHFKYVALDDG